MREIYIVKRRDQLSQPCRNCQQPITKEQKYYHLGRRGVVHIEHFSADNLPPVFPERIFGEESLLNTQAHPKAPWVRQQYLYLAILEDALMCVFKYQFLKNRYAQRMEKEALDWITTEDDIWGCSFNNCCRAIEIDPAYVRRGILRRREEVYRAVVLQNRSMEKVTIPISRRNSHPTPPHITVTERER